MRKTATAVIAVALHALVFAVPAHAQGSSTAEVKLTMEQSHVLKEFLLADSSIQKAAKADFQVGDKVPTEVAIRTFPDEVAQKVPAVKAHRFFIGGQKIFIVSASDGTVSAIVE